MNPIHGLIYGFSVAVTPENIGVALLGVVKSGAAYVALDPAYPVERLQMMVKDADVAFVVAGEDVTAELGAPRLTVAETRDAPDREPAVAPAPHNAMYVVYTSGSTGRPKAVIMDHGPTARLMLTLTALAATAVGRSRLGTSKETMASHAGAVRASPAATRNAKASRLQGVTRRNHTSTAKPLALIVMSVSPRMRKRRLSTISTKAPAGMASRHIGRVAAT